MAEDNPHTTRHNNLLLWPQRSSQHQQVMAACVRPDGQLKCRESSGGHSGCPALLFSGARTVCIGPSDFIPLLLERVTCDVGEECLVY